MKQPIKYLLTGIALVLFFIYMTDYNNLSNLMAITCPYFIGIALGFWVGDSIKDDKNRRK